ncbi:hypothetical protein AMAG_02497 [Allomyces macrogynus ATCC 38327]|uniref:Uncharacterized protein n=1 Tax=Allomyces macrogynus (strain ATCC 38327) TaxID=578462 RepID=A0A0L0S2E5_ALLM3|nr:hypothetical protein AMAG_02497 [Allomyces macrogynus ATCC 38327]|eukprot:KNE56718.1 hypothetical protein AMAG_02497 [Allomyces macrogynus ATCC 38327]
MLRRALHHPTTALATTAAARRSALATSTRTPNPSTASMPDNADRPVPGIPLTGPANAPLPASHPPNDEIPPPLAGVETPALIVEEALHSPRSDPHVPKSVAGKVVRKVKDLMHPLNAGAEAAAEAIAQHRREAMEAEQEQGKK